MEEKRLIDEKSMIEAKALFLELAEKQLQQIILSNSRDKKKIAKKKIRPVLIKDILYFQETAYVGTKVLHENMTREELIDRLLADMEMFRQCELESVTWQASILISKKGTLTIKKRRKKTAEDDVKQNGTEMSHGTAQVQTDLSHNRKKQYIMEEGTPADFLVELGVQTKQGKVVHAKYDKFRQINRFLEFIQDIVKELPEKKRLHIIDFGCGKSYLTFAMYYYFHEICKRDIDIVGLDLKEDVIQTCNGLAQKLQYENLKFQKGDISHYTEEGAAVDMVVTLHACDTATDFALDKAIKWGAKVILSVPCCQHEVNRQIKSREWEPVLKYGLLKERLSAILTDAVRANLLEESGYTTQILEFIDMEHTPKNLLIRAVKRNNMRPVEHGSRVEELTEKMNVNTTLQRLLQDNMPT